MIWGERFTVDEAGVYWLEGAAAPMNSEGVAGGGYASDD